MELPSGVDSDLLEELADEHGTPLYVTSAETIRERYAELEDAFAYAQIQYAAKANTNPRILEVLRNLGATVDAVSLGEVVAAERAGFSSDEIMYTGVNPPDDELDAILEKGVTVNADAVNILDRITSSPGSRYGTEIGIRVNPRVGAGHHEHVVTAGDDSKFGVRESRVVDAYRRAEELGIKPVGMHMHIGSGILEPDPLVRAVEKLAVLVESIQEEGFRLKYIDIGGGLGVPYREDEERLDLEKLSEEIKEIYDDLGTNADLIIEPGRFLVAESTVLVTRVNTRKRGFVGVDAGLNTLLRPAMYDSYHHISNISSPDARERNLDIVGPICESGDYLGRDRTLAEPQEGDLLAVHNAGAYGYSMASRYNSRPLPAEVLVDSDTELIRERETIDDLFSTVRGGGRD